MKTIGSMRGKTIAVLLLSVLLCVSAGSLASGRSGASATTKISLQLAFPTLSIGEAAGGTVSLTMEGYPGADIAGRPVLPSKVVPITLPPGMSATAVTVANDQWERRHLDAPVECGQPPASSEGPMPSKAAPDGTIYDSSAQFPKHAVALKGTGMQREVPIADVQVNPVLYFPASNDIEVCTRMTLEVQCQPDARYAARQSNAAPAPNDGGTADYVIITTDTLASSVTPLVTYKESLGQTVNITTTSWIYANCTGSDDAAKVRKFLTDRYLSWGIENVLIVGSPDSVPMRSCYTPVGSAPILDYTPTDYYYSELSGNWDRNGDGKYGQYGVDDGPGGVDFHAEVAVGRIFDDDPATVTTICNKTVAFEQDTGAWKHKALLGGAVSNFENEDSKGWNATWGSSLTEEMMTDITNPLGFANFTQYEKSGIVRTTAPISPDPLACNQPLTEANFVGEWNNHFGVVNWWAHGGNDAAARKYWANDDDGDGIPQGGEMTWSEFINSGDAASLDDSHPSIVFACSCDCGWPEDASNLGASLLRNGAAATVTASRDSWYTIGWRNHNDGGNAAMDYCFFGHLLLDGDTAGEALRESDVDYYDNYCWWADQSYANLYDFNLYGDPGMRLDALTHVPTIGSLSTASTYTGCNVTITGTDFGASRGLSTVRFGTVPCADSDYISWSPTSITVKVPAGLYGGPLSLKVHTATGGDSSGQDFYVAPNITSVSPTKGNAGSAYVTLTGTGFGPTRGASSVWFGSSKAAVYSSWSNTSIRVQAGAGAQGQAHVKVFASGCCSNAKAFDVRPSITSITPSSGPSGTTITISGSGFCNSQGQGCVYFGSKAVTSVASWKQTQIKVKVPSGDSGTIPVKVYTPGGMSNQKNFAKT